MRSVALAIAAAASALLLAACGEKSGQTAQEREIERMATQAMREAGKKGKVTVAGGKMRYTDPETGKEIVMTLPTDTSRTDDAPMPGATWHVKDEDGEGTVALGADAKIPARFPKDIPVYPGARIVMAVDNPDLIMVKLMTQDDVKKVSDAYAALLRAQGWEVNVGTGMVGGSLVSASKGDRTMSANILSGKRGTVIQLMVGQPQARPAQE